MNIREICDRALFRYNEKSKFLLEDSLVYDENKLIGEFVCSQLYLKDGEKSSAMNNTDFMMLSNQVCYLIIYCYFIKKLGYTLDEMFHMHGNIAIYKQNFSFKRTVNIAEKNKFNASIQNVKKNRLGVSIEVNDGSYAVEIKLVVLKENIHF